LLPPDEDSATDHEALAAFAAVASESAQAGDARSAFRSYPHTSSLNPPRRWYAEGRLAAGAGDQDEI
jgi:hypothetical protein